MVFLQGSARVRGVFRINEARDNGMHRVEYQLADVHTGQLYRQGAFFPETVLLRAS